MAEHALGRGDRVAVTARNRQAVTDLATTYGDRALALELDVTDPGSVTTAVQRCEAEFGRIDTLVNNAGYGYLAAIAATGYYHATKFALEGLSESLAVSGRQPGDPERAAAAIATAVDADTPPQRLLLGSDALTGARARLDRTRREIDANEALTKSTDREEV